MLNIRSPRSWIRILGSQEVLLIYDFMKGPEVRLSKIERDREISELKDCKKTGSEGQTVHTVRLIR